MCCKTVLCFIRNVMSIPLLIFEVISVAIFVIFISHYYGNWKKHRVVVIGLAFLAWYMSFLIVAILPIDISVTYFLRCKQIHNTTSDETSSPQLLNIYSNNSLQFNTSNISDTLNPPQLINEESNATSAANICESPWLMVNPNVLYYFWHIVYWTCNVLTWIVLPILRSYAQAGDFTVGGKIRTALIDNAIYYTSYLVIFVVVLVFLVARHDVQLHWWSLKVLLITVSNTWGLFLVILFLGYGLVAVPRAIWREASIPQSLRAAYVDVAKLSMEKIEYEEALEEVILEIKRYVQSIPSAHPLRKYLEIILRLCQLDPNQTEVLDAQSSSVQSGISSLSRYVVEDGGICEGTGGGDLPTLKALVRCHRRLKVCQHRTTRSEALWREAVLRAAWLEDIERNLAATPSGHRFQGSLPDSSFSCTPSSLRNHWLLLEWLWKCRLRSVILRGVSLIFMATSLVVIASECTFFIKKPVLSIFALLFQMAARDYNYLFIAFVCFLLIGYLCTCVYYTVFKVRLLNYFQLVPHHQTDENSLLFSAILLCNLTPPLCLNFLGMIHLDSRSKFLSSGMTTSNSTYLLSNITTAANATLAGGSNGGTTFLAETAYTNIMGHMSVVWFIADGFNIYFPILVLLLSTASLLRLGDRCLHRIGFSDFMTGGGHSSQEVVDEGKCLLRKERLVKKDTGKRSPRKTGSSRATGNQYRRFDMSNRVDESSGHVNSAIDMTELRIESGKSGPEDAHVIPPNPHQLLGSMDTTPGDHWDRSRLVIDDPMDFSEDAVAQYLTSVVAPNNQTA